MIMVNESLRISPVTGHVSLKNVPGEITSEKIIAKLAIMNQALKRDFGIRKPRIAVLSLNPHAGDGGLIGKEEEENYYSCNKKIF